MNHCRTSLLAVTLLSMLVLRLEVGLSQTTALWCFDEPVGLYPSHVLDDLSANNYPLVIGQAGKLSQGRFGNALEPVRPPAIRFPKGETEFGLAPLPIPQGRTVEPMTWMNANFTALMTSGEHHLRKEVGFVNPTGTKLNLGAFDWTVEFWFLATKDTDQAGVVFEIGEGPRGENDRTTRLSLDADRKAFTLTNQPGGVVLRIPSSRKALATATSSAWHHLAFVYSASEGQLRHYVDGRSMPAPGKSRLKALNHGDDSYLSVGRDGRWQRPLPGRIDELRFSASQIYQGAFQPPSSFAPKLPELKLLKGLPLLFGHEVGATSPIRLGNRKHLFFDDALLERAEYVRFAVNPPRKAERVIDNIQGTYRKHLTVVEDEEGLIRIYNAVEKDHLAVQVSRDGIHFEAPKASEGVTQGEGKIVIPQPVGGLGNPFIDPNGPPEERWKYFTGYHNRGIYLLTSPDGYKWNRQPTATLSFRSGTQSCTYYDDQRQRYVSYHRSGIFRTPAGATQRTSVLTEHTNLKEPLAFTPLTQDDYLKLAQKVPLREPLPWYLDNGPLTPGGFGMEFSPKFRPLPEDPVGTDLYVTKAQKYPWAPDTYVAFPIVYFHYEMDGPAARQILLDPKRGRGSGPLETQVEVSRDGLHWKRHPRPAYVGLGEHAGRHVVTAYIAHGMVRRGDEIWQYYFGETQYHSAWKDGRDPEGRGVYRLVQRLDGFVSIDSPYDREAVIVTKPLVFEGNRLTLNIDTDAAGYAQVGFLDESGKPVTGYSVNDCVYINGDFVRTKVEWIKNSDKLNGLQAVSEDSEAPGQKVISSFDVSALAGKTVQLVFRMRGAKLYAMQFVQE